MSPVSAFVGVWLYRNFGLPEIAVILVIILFLFPPRRTARRVSKSVLGGIRGFIRGFSEEDDN